MPDLNTSYQHNIKFWEDAWLRVKNPYRKLADLDYIPEIPEVFKQHNCSTILDIACGSGWLAFYLASFGFKPVGVDISPSAIALANRWISEDTNGTASAEEQAVCATGTQELVKATKDAQFYVADMMNLAPVAKHFPQGGFDGLLVNASFEHLDYNRGAEFLKHVAKYVKSGGIMYGIFDKVGEGGKGDYIELEDGTKQYTDKFRDGMFLRYYSDAELRNLLLQSGWKVLSWRENAAGSRIVVAENSKKNLDLPLFGSQAKVQSSSLVNLHTLIALVIVTLIYFVYSKTLAQGVLVASASLNLYLRMLCFSFVAQIDPNNNPIIMMLVSGLRAFLAAGLLFFAVIKFKISIIAILIAILIYLLVLLVSGFKRR